MSILEEIKDLQEKFEELFANTATINEVNAKTVSDSLDKRIDKSIEADEKDSKRFSAILSMTDRKEKMKALQELVKNSEERRNEENKKLDLYANWIAKHDKSESLAESISIMEALLVILEGKGGAEKEVNKISRTKKDKNDEPIEVVSVADELFPYKGTAKEQYNQKIIAKINDMIEGTATLDDLVQLVRQKKTPVKESLDEGKAKDPDGYKKNIDIANHYDHLYSKEPAVGPDGSPNSVAGYYKQKYQNYFDKAMKCYYGDGSCKNDKKSSVKESLMEAISLMEEVVLNLPEKKDDYNFIATGCTKENGGTLFKIHTKHDKGVTKSKLYAKSPEDALRVVQRGYGGPDSAHKIVEAIINEVSIKKWKEAAANVLPKRKEEAEAARTSAEKGWDEYDRAARKYPEDEPALYRLAQANDEEAQKAEDRADHAYAVTRLRTKAKSANKAIEAARKVQDSREDEFGRNPEKRTFLRSGKANQLVSADPVKSRTEG